MRWTWAPVKARRALTAALAAVVIAGCGSDEPPSNFSITGANNATAEILQGSNGNLLLTITRNNFAKDITLELVGLLPDGVTSTFSQNPVPADQPTVNVSFTITSVAAPATVSLTVKASAEGVEDLLIPITLKINLRGTHTLSLPTPTLVVAQGGGGTATVRINRVDNNAGTVTLTATAPAGITASFSQSATSGTGTSVLISAAANLGAGDYTVTVKGTQAGVSPDPTTTLTVTVVAPKPTTDLTLTFCGDAAPSWLAYQNEGFNWKQVQPAGNLFTFAATDKVGIALTYVLSSTSSYTSVTYATRQELAGAFSDHECFGTRSLTGTTASVGSSQFAHVGMGGFVEAVTNNAFALDFLPTRPLDLIAVRGSASAFSFSPDRMIVRRGVATASGALPVLDFATGEAISPATNTLTMVAVGSDPAYVETHFGGATSSRTFLFSAEPSGPAVTFSSFPANMIVAGDLHELYAEAFNFTSNSLRLLRTWYSAPADRTVTFTPLLNPPTLAVAATAPYLRIRGQLESQSAYPTLVRFRFGQGNRENRVEMTAAYLGATPTTWDVTFPDLTAASGFSTTWAMVPGVATAYNALGFAGRPELLFGTEPTLIGVGLGAKPVANDLISTGLRVGTISANAASIMAPMAFPYRRNLSRGPLGAPQYFRR